MTTNDNPAANRFKGYCFNYDRFRPVPPKELMELGLGWTQKTSVERVVDLGCGTGLSTRPWADHAKHIIGVDPSPDMLATARAATPEDHVAFVHGFGHATGLEASCADIVTCATSVHWMEPEPTIAEVARILKPGGLFMIYDHYYPLFLTSPDLTRFYENWRQNTVRMERSLPGTRQRKWSTTETLDAVKGSAIFSYQRKHYIHSRMMWTADDFRGYIMAHSVVHVLREHGASDQALMLDEMERLLAGVGEHVQLPVHLTYMVNLAIAGQAHQ